MRSSIGAIPRIGEIGRRALTLTFERAGIRHMQDEVHYPVSQIERLRPFDDVVEALRRLKMRYALVMLSNGDPDMLENAKPPIDRIMHVANHAFDCIGAQAAGMKAAFINRRDRRTPIRRFGVIGPVYLAGHARIIIVDRSLLKRVKARHAGSRDVLRITRNEGQTMHVGGGGQQAVDGGECRQRVHPAPLFRHLPIHEQDSRLVLRDQGVKPSIQHECPRPVATMNRLDTAAEFSDRQHTQKQLTIIDASEPLPNARISTLALAQLGHDIAV